MRYSTIRSQECIEVYSCEPMSDGQLLGYAIWFSGGWDGWRVDYPLRTQMTKVAICESTGDKAVQAIVNNQRIYQHDAQEAQGLERV
jgi:hypothetical protein